MSIRAACVDDAPAIAALASEMQYTQVTNAVMALRIAHITQNPSCAIFVLERESIVVAWLQVHAVPLLATPSEHPRGGYAEIGGLVVHALQRRGGIARALIAHASDWALAHGFNRLRLYNNAQRIDAHAAYRALGFSERDSKAWTQT